MSLIFCLVFCLCVIAFRAQPPLFRHYQYIEKYAEEAQTQMLVYRIPASVTLAQAIKESASGTSDLARRSNNHFGIKCHREWTGDFVRKDDDSLNECFRSYPSIKDSYTDHSLFLLTRPRYAHLFSLPITDYKGWCRGLKASGYATAPRYAEDLIAIIEDLELYKLDGPVLLEKRDLPAAEKQIILSPFNASQGKLNYFASSGALFLKEQDFVFQSLITMLPSVYRSSL